MPTPNFQEIWANLPDWMRTADSQHNDYFEGDTGSVGQAYNDFMWWLKNTPGGQQYAQQNPYWQQQLANPQTFQNTGPSYEYAWSQLPEWMTTADGQYEDYENTPEGQQRAYDSFINWLTTTMDGRLYQEQNPYWRQQVLNYQNAQNNNQGDPPAGDPPAGDPPGGPPPPTDPYKSQASRDALNAPGTGGRFNRIGGPKPPKNLRTGTTPGVPTPPPPPPGGGQPGGGIGIWQGGNPPTPPPPATPPPGTDPPQADTGPTKPPPATLPPVTGNDQDREKAAALTASTTGPRVTTTTGPRNPSAFVGHIKRLKGY